MLTITSLRCLFSDDSLSDIPDVTLFYTVFFSTFCCRHTSAVLMTSSPYSGESHGIGICLKLEIFFKKIHPENERRNRKWKRVVKVSWGCEVCCRHHSAHSKPQAVTWVPIWSKWKEQRLLLLFNVLEIQPIRHIFYSLPTMKLFSKWPTNVFYNEVSLRVQHPNIRAFSIKE